MISTESLLFGMVGGLSLGVVLALTRSHMTGRATWVFCMLYYVLFMGLLNIHRFFADKALFDQHFTPATTRAVVFATVAALVVYLANKYKRWRLERYMEHIEHQVNKQ